MMKNHRTPQTKRRSALKFFLLVAPLAIVAYALSRRESSAISVMLDGDSYTKDTRAAVEDTANTHTTQSVDSSDLLHTQAISEDELEEDLFPPTLDVNKGGEGGRTSSDGTNNVDYAPANDSNNDNDSAANKQSDYGRVGDDVAWPEDDEDMSNDTNQENNNSEGGDASFVPRDHDSPLDAFEEAAAGSGIDGDDGGELNDDEDPTGGAAFSGEGLDAGDEQDGVEQAGDDISLSMEAKQSPGSGVLNNTGLVDMVFGKAQDEDVKEVLGWMGKCQTLACIIKAHDRLQGRTRFNFPHFFLIGWQKCATTSVNAYLRYHPQYLPGVKKEPHWFSVCQNNLKAPHCLPQTEAEYLRDFLRLEDAVASRLELVTLDASADYAGRGGVLARKLYRLFPWIKVVIMIREPISRLISYTRMHTQSTFQEWKACSPGSSLFTCLRPHLTPGAANSNYSDALLGWLTTFPTDQLHVIQFEELQETPEKVLYDLKAFLGMDVDLPDRTIANVNSRREGRGYPMGRGQYMRLVRMVKQDAERTAEMLDRYGLADKTAWLSRWQSVWNEWLNECPTFEEECSIDSN
ncbi:hypothetical protein Ndes2526B_g03676 [Nannochloris sp. 'desiccata']